MATWTTPKTDWYGATVSGIYSGDYFNYDDYNRIKNNLEYLHELCEVLYNNYNATHTELDDKTVSSFIYADEINAIEENLEALNEATLNHSIGSSVTYMANGLMIDYTELNRIESATLELYEYLINQSNGRRHLSFNLSNDGGGLF